MYLVSLTYLKPFSEVERFLEAHRAFLVEQYAAGAFLLSGPKDPRTGGVIVAVEMPLERLQSILDKDPFHLNGVAAYEVQRFVPLMTAEALAHLKEER